MIEPQVTSPEVSIRLHEAFQKVGLDFISEFVWVQDDRGEWVCLWRGEDRNTKGGVNAYLATELLEWMPGEITENDFVSPLRIEREVYSIGKVWRPTYTCSSVPSIIDVDLPDALGKMCLYLLANNLIPQ